MAKYEGVSHLYITRLKEREDTAVVAVEDILRIITRRLGVLGVGKQYTNADILEVTLSSGGNLVVATSDGIRHVYDRSYILFEKGLLFQDTTIEQPKRSRP